MVTVPSAMFFEPQIKGAEMLTACCYSFLIKHNSPDAESKYDTLVFDLGVRKDLENSPKVIVNQIKEFGMNIPVEKNVIDVLKDGGEDPAKVGGIIWSHWHLVCPHPSPHTMATAITSRRTTQAIPPPSRPRPT